MALLTQDHRLPHLPEIAHQFKFGVVYPDRLRIGRQQTLALGWWTAKNHSGISRRLAVPTPGVETRSLLRPETCSKQVVAQARVCFSTLGSWQTPISIGGGAAARPAR